VSVLPASDLAYNFPVVDAAGAKATALFIAWAKNFDSILAEHDVLAVESEFQFPLLNPETGSPSKTFLEAGKIDGILRCKSTGKVKVLEHKTTSDDLGSNSNYWARLTMDTQVSKYLLAARAAGHNCNTVIYDVVRKPQYDLKQIPIADEDGVVIVLGPDGQRVRTKDGKRFRQTGDYELGYVVQTREETIHELHQRTLNALEADPAKYLHLREIARQDEEILEYMEDAWCTSKQILYFRQKNLWPRNPSACLAFGTCEYFDLCAGRAEVDGINFGAYPTSPHNELEMQVPEGQSLLTNSRISALRKCSRYHSLRYEKNIRSLRTEDEALRVGTIFHQLAESYIKQWTSNH